jgi:hypothetical protein
MLKCIIGKKLGDSILKTEDGSLISIYPNQSYPLQKTGCWLLQPEGQFYTIQKVLFISIPKEFQTNPSLWMLHFKNHN